MERSITVRLTEEEISALGGLLYNTISESRDPDRRTPLSTATDKLMACVWPMVPLEAQEQHKANWLAFFHIRLHLSYPELLKFAQHVNTMLAVWGVIGNVDPVTHFTYNKIAMVTWSFLDDDDKRTIEDHNVRLSRVFRDPSVERGMFFGGIEGLAESAKQIENDEL